MLRERFAFASFVFLTKVWLARKKAIQMIKIRQILLRLVVGLLAGCPIISSTQEEANPYSAIPEIDNSVAPLVDLTGNKSNPLVVNNPKDQQGKLDKPTGLKSAVPENFENGARLGELKSRSKVEESYVPKRFKVYPVDPDSHYWEINVREAFSRSRREMRPMLLLFTARWRPEAMNLSNEVFATKSFNNYVKDNLVICYLDYPSNVRQAPKSMQWAKKEFKVAGYPNVLIFSPKGEVVRSIRGYRQGRPVDYFNELKAACGPVISEIRTVKSALQDHGYRNWSNSEGKSIFAKFVKRNDVIMMLQDAYSQNWTVTINQLSKDDQVMAMTFPKLEELLQQEK